MTDERQALRACLADVEDYARFVTRKPLRPYQLAPARAIAEAVLGQTGGAIAVLMSRQAGKNETSAQLEAYLMTLYSGRGGQIVKCAPTWKPQIVNSILRLRDRLTNPLTGEPRGEFGYILRVGTARAVFLSAAAEANVVGATASLMLEVDEAQDVDPTKYGRDFAPMAASTNALRVFWGTAWTDDDLLQTTKAHLLELQRRDGRRRVFEAPWWVVAEGNPAYAAHVQGERDRLGDNHPIFQTQYCLNPVSRSDRLLGDQHLRLLQGEHPLQTAPRPGATYVASVDVAGPAEVDPADEDAAPREHDRTVLAIGELAGDDELRQRVCQLVALYVWEGLPHRQQRHQIPELLRFWTARRVVVDATGLGEPLAEDLVAQLGEGVVEPFKITGAGKSALGFDLISSVNTHALALPRYGPDDHDQVTLWRELRATTRRMRSATLMSWAAKPPQHDDTVVALALLNRAARVSPPAPASSTIKLHDRYQDEGRY